MVRDRVLRRENDQVPPGEPNAKVACATVAELCSFDLVDDGAASAREVGGAVGRARVDDDGLDVLRNPLTADAVEASREVLARIPDRDDNANHDDW